MTWTSSFGRACGVLLDAIVRWLALARINPNVLTAMGLVVNTIAAFLFGYANGDNQARMFRSAGLVIIGSGFFDLVDGQVARARNKVTRFGGFFDSVVDRYSDASQFLGLLVFYARGQRFAYVILTAFVMISAIMVSYTRARHHRRALQSYGAGSVGHRGAFHHHRDPSHRAHLAADPVDGNHRSGRQNRPRGIDSLALRPPPYLPK